MIYGYIRVSSQKQSVEHQEYEIKQYALKKGIKIDSWIEETISSRKALKHRKLGQLCSSIQLVIMLSVLRSECSMKDCSQGLLRLDI